MLELVAIAGTLVPGVFAKLFYAPLATLGLPTHFETIPGQGLDDIHHATEKVTHKYFEQRDGEYIFFGQSQGGLVALEAAVNYPKRVHKVISEGTPYSGTKWCNLARHVLPFRAIECMAYGSEYTRKLLDGLPPGVEVHSFATLLDYLVWPKRSSYIEGAANYLIAPKLLHDRLRRKLPSDIQLIDGLADHIMAFRLASVLTVIRQIITQPGLSAN